MKHKNSTTSVVTVGNAAELTARVAEKIIGGEVGSHFAGGPLNTQAVLQLATSNIQKQLTQRTGG